MGAIERGQLLASAATTMTKIWSHKCKGLASGKRNGLLAFSCIHHILQTIKCHPDIIYTLAECKIIILCLSRCVIKGLGTCPKYMHVFVRTTLWHSVYTHFVGGFQFASPPFCLYVQQTSLPHMVQVIFYLSICNGIDSIAKATPRCHKDVSIISFSTCSLIRLYLSGNAMLLSRSQSSWKQLMCCK